MNCVLSGAVLLALLPACLRAEEGSVFGSKTSEAGLIGIIYDLKQTQKRQPVSEHGGTYQAVIHEFLEKKWDEAVLNRYFRSAKPLYLTQLFIPRMNADAAPRAFEAQDVIKPSRWLVHYKGQVAPPEDGVYRFVAHADDVIAVAVNGKTVCLAGYLPMPDLWQSAEPKSKSNLICGDWVPLKKGKPFDLDVIVGERPGGFFSAFLLYEKQGDTYQRSKRGEPVRPVMQMLSAPLPEVSPSTGPEAVVSGNYWKGYQ